MRAVVQRRYGPPASVLSVAELPDPVPGPGEVLVRVRGASVHPDIWHAVSGRPYVLRLMGSGIFRPRNPVPGIDLAGVVEAVGPDCSKFGVGDAVFGEVHGGMHWGNGGAFAELCAAPEKHLCAAPANLPLEQAAAVPVSGCIAVQAVHDEGGVQGQRVLINGAGGGVGTFAVQLAKAAGAEVTAVDHTAKQALLGALGADGLIDYTEQDVAASSERWDVVIDIASTLTPKQAAGLLTDGGRYVFIGHDHYGENAGRWIGSIRGFLRIQLSRALRGHRPPSIWNIDTSHRMPLLKELLEEGRLTVPVARTFPLEEVVEALSCLRDENPPGKVVLVP